MTTLQDILGLIKNRKIKTPSDKDYIVSAAYINKKESLKTQPEMQTSLLSIGAIKKYIIDSLPSNLSGQATLQDVTDEGNSTTNNIQFFDNAKIIFDNGSKLQKGTTNAYTGGNGGISQICSIDYELKWEAGRQYLLGQDGFTIREVNHTFTFTPDFYDDETKGFVPGSRWVLDNGDTYVCVDNTEGNAIWEAIYLTTSQEFDPQFTDISGTVEGVTTRASYTMLAPKICFFKINVDFADCSNFGTLGYEITLPFPAASTMRQAGGTLHQPTNGALYHIAGITDASENSSIMKLYYSGSTTDLAWKYNTPVAGTTITSHFDISGTYEID